MANLISAGDGFISEELLGSWPALNQGSIELQSFEKSVLSHFFVTLVKKYVYLIFEIFTSLLDTSKSLITF